MSAISRLSSTRVHESSTVVGSMRGANGGWISEDQPIGFDQQDPRDADRAYIDTRHHGFVGFGAGTLADMTLTPLLLVQVPLALVSALRLEAAEHGAWPFSSESWITSAISRLSSTRVHESSTVVGSMRGANGGWISEDQPIGFDQQDPRDADRAYIDTRHHGFVGFGAGTLADMTLTPLLLVQVSHYYTSGSQKLVCALPAPPTMPSVCTKNRGCSMHRLRLKRFRLFSNRVIYLILLLILARDVELNPGPTNTPEMELLQCLQSGQETLISKLNGIEARFERNENILMDVKNNLRQTRKQIKDISMTVTEQAAIIRHPMQQVKDLQKKTNDLENRSRRKNLVFYGVDDKPSESWDESEATVKKICKTSLGIELRSLERAHRLGRYNENRKRPIIVKFSLYKERQVVLLNAKKFKNSLYSVGEDYSSETRNTRKKLWEYAKAKREDKNNKVKLNFDKLIINGRAFRWDEDKEEVVPLRRQ
ncbi:uncharacterized protein LOC125944250 isoform X2 [Dermacentor silvarum]|uniref:uncharacterized protein LOC125944250 isoform X2 n=1 Tax=Dermacentor silvarum TaxID=543639 RepID=UPI0021010547|nr:uncharacterized protein LOC125944250 isoform X2 [Dermacentor silvarum]